MSATMKDKERQIRETKEIIVEIRESCNKMQEKINRLKKAGSRGDIEKIAEDINAVIEVLNEADQDLSIKTLKQIESIKNKMLAQYDKVSNLQHEVDRINTKASLRRQFVPNEAAKSSNCSPHAALDRSSTQNNEKSIAKLKGILGKAPENFVRKGNSKQFHQSAMPTPFGGNFSLFSSIQPSYNNTIVFDDECSNLEDYQALLGSKENKSNEKGAESKKRMPKLQIDSSFNNYMPSKFELSAKNSPNSSVLITKKLKETVKENAPISNKTQQYLEKIWNLETKFGTIGTSCESVRDFENENNNLFLKDANQLKQFFEEGNIGESKNFLWKYIFSIQENLLAIKESYERKLHELQQEMNSKDETIKQLMKKQQKVDISAETKYYDNLKLAYNSEKMIAMIKNNRQKNNQENNTVVESPTGNCAKSIDHQQLKSPTFKKGFNSTVQNSLNSFLKKSFTPTETHSSARAPLRDASINKSLEINTEICHTSYRKTLNDTMPSPASSQSTLNSNQGEDELNFLNPTNWKSFIKNLQETITIMKENNTVVQSENLKLKESMHLLKNKLIALERENERLLLANYRSIGQKDKGNKNEISILDTYKSLNPTKTIGLEHKYKSNYNFQRFKSISYVSQETENY